jgi:hypothetical protein
MKSSASGAASDEAAGSDACGTDTVPVVATTNSAVESDVTSDDDSDSEAIVIPKMTANVEVEREHTFREMESEVMGNRVQRESSGLQQQSRKVQLKGSTSSRGTNSASSTGSSSKRSTTSGSGSSESSPKKISLIRKPRAPGGGRDSNAAGSPPAGASSRGRRP